MFDEQLNPMRVMLAPDTRLMDWAALGRAPKIAQADRPHLRTV